MRVALLHPFSWPAVRRGGERYVHDLAWWLATQGHDVDFVTVGEADTTEYADGGRIVRLAPRQAGRKPRLRRRKVEGFGAMAERWLDAHRYDVVQALTPEGALAAKATGHRTLFSVIGHPGPLTKPGRHDDLRSFTAAAKAADLTSALSTSAAEAAREAFGVEAVVLPPGVRLDVFSPKLRARSGPPVLLFTGDAGDQRKRLSILLQAMPMVQRSLPDVRLVIAGPGDPRASVDPAIAHAIEWRGPGDLGDVADLYRSAHVTIMPSLNEAFGLVLLESLACGTPIVGVRSGATADLVVPDVGRLAEPDDPGTLAVAIIETVSLATAPSTPAACVEQSARWGWEAVGARHLAAYERATGTTR